MSEPHRISSEDIKQALEPFEKIRRAVGDRIDIMVELHAIWRMPAALAIAKAVEPYDPFWYEDPIRADSLDALKAFADSTRVPVCASETVGSRWNHRDLLSANAAAIIMPDVVWCGGLTEARKIAALADAWHRPIAPHDCTGPVAFAAAVHLSLSVPNALVQESVRAFHTGWYRELVTEVPRVEQGYIYPMEGPGLGTELLPDLTERKDAHVQTSK